MAFNKCSINGISYGEVMDPRTGELLEITEDTPSIDLSANPYWEAGFKFYDPNLTEGLAGGDKNCQEFFRLLALCHTVMPEYKNSEFFFSRVKYRV